MGPDSGTSEVRNNRGTVDTVSSEKTLAVSEMEMDGAGLR